MAQLWTVVAVLLKVGHNHDSAPEKPGHPEATLLHFVPYLPLGLYSPFGHKYGPLPPELIPPLRTVGMVVLCGGILLGPAY